MLHMRYVGRVIAALCDPTESKQVYCIRLIYSFVSRKYIRDISVQNCSARSIVVATCQSHRWDV